MQCFPCVTMISVTLLVRLAPPVSGQLLCQVCGCPAPGQAQTISLDQCSGQCKGMYKISKYM